MEPVHAPDLPTAGRAIDLEGWARHALGNATGHGAGGSADDVARALWRTAWTAAANEVDRPHAARAWFDDLARGRVVLPGHLIVPPRGTERPAEVGVVDASTPVEPDALAGHLRTANGARAVLASRARWVHPALRAVAVGVCGPPLVRGWINLAAFAVPGPRAAFAARTADGRPSGAVDWVELRATVLRAIRLFDGLLGVFDARGQVSAVDREWRRVGLGLAGLDDALDALGLDYDGPSSALQARKLALCVVDHAHRASVELGLERGVFPRFGETLWAKRGRPRRHGLCTLSWTSDGLLEACGLSEGAAPAGDRPLPDLEVQLAMQVECQRAYEGVFDVVLATDEPLDAAALARDAIEHDVQCLSVDDRSVPPAAVNGYGATTDELTPFASDARGDEVRERPDDAVFSVTPALRLAAETERGRWRLDVVYDEDGDREVELVLVTAPPRSDGWRLVDRLNAELDRGHGLPEALASSAEAVAEPAGGARELHRVLTAFAARRGYGADAVRVP